MNHDRLKLGIINGLSWVGTGITLQHVQTVVAILAGLASVVVSIVSILWIRKQARALDKRWRD